MAECRKVTIKDVAEAAGCSVASVCYAFSGSDKIREETRKRILRIADRLGYVPNKAAQALSRNPKHIGVVVPDSYDEVMRLFKQGIADAVDSYMWCHLNCTMFGYEWYSLEGQIHALEDLLRMPTCDGIVLSLNFAEAEKLRPFLERINEMGKPVVCITESSPLLHDIAMVGVDAVAIGEAAADLLGHCGCSRVSAIVGDFTSAIHRENFEGFSRRAAELGIVVTRSGTTYNDAEIAYTVTRELLETEAPDGLFVTSYIAEAVCRAVRDAGQAGTCRIVSVDLCNGVSAALERGELVASFYQNQIEQGRTATNLLADAIFAGGKSSPGQRVLIKPDIVVKDLLKFYQ